ncbi:DUF6250 domain-containing protein [Lentisphaerota bacterium WC36G]|nr:DUF6250 domain-containing protein [Lentisphaerae bacterium WC36]
MLKLNKKMMTVPLSGVLFLLGLCSCNMSIDFDGSKDGMSVIIPKISFKEQTQFIADRLLYTDFFSSLNDWVIQQQTPNSVKVEDNVLKVYEPKGATVWFKKKLTEPVMIQYEVTMRENVRVSDMNCFWMASNADGSAPFKPDRKKGETPMRNGAFSEYDNMKTYYVGCGGHNNTKTRFRRYAGNGEKPLFLEHDLIAKKYLLEANKIYKIQLVVFGETIQYFRNGELFYDFKDSKPFTKGYFGFRAYNASYDVKNFRVFSLKRNK